MSAVVTQTHCTAEEYLARERSASCKSEFRDGQIFAMTGVSRQHNLITVNIARELSVQLKKRPCEAYMNDMRVKAAETRLPLSRHRCCVRHPPIRRCTGGFLTQPYAAD